jgi:hypothetical protein
MYQDLKMVNIMYREGLSFRIISCLGYTITPWLVTRLMPNTTFVLAFEMEVYISAWLPIGIHKLFALNN